MKNIIRLFKKRNYCSVYEILKRENYEYTLENFYKDFKCIDSMNKYCYLIYLLSIERTVKNTLLLCDFLIYTDTFFFDINHVIKMFIQQILTLFPGDVAVLEWVVSTYDGHPDSPFGEEELRAFKAKIK